MARKRGNQESVEEFWRRTEEELGEKVMVYAMGRCLSGCVASDQPMWGLCFVTDGGFYFRHFPQANWFRLLTDRLAGESASEEDIYLSVSRNQIQQVEVHRTRSWWKKLFSYSPPVLQIDYLEQRGTTGSMRLVIESDVERFADALHG